MASFNQFIQTRVKLIENMTSWKSLRKKGDHFTPISTPHPPYYSKTFFFLLSRFTEVRCHALSQSPESLCCTEAFLHIQEHYKRTLNGALQKDSNTQYSAGGPKSRAEATGNCKTRWQVHDMTAYDRTTSWNHFLTLNDKIQYIYIWSEQNLILDDDPLLYLVLLRFNHSVSAETNPPITGLWGIISTTGKRWLEIIILKKPHNV